jgi:hypothetical protein
MGLLSEFLILILKKRFSQIFLRALRELRGKNGLR